MSAHIQSIINAEGCKQRLAEQIVHYSSALERARDNLKKRIETKVSERLIASTAELVQYYAERLNEYLDMRDSL